MAQSKQRTLHEHITAVKNGSRAFENAFQAEEYAQISRGIFHVPLKEGLPHRFRESRYASTGLESVIEEGRDVLPHGNAREGIPFRGTQGCRAKRFLAGRFLVK